MMDIKIEEKAIGDVTVLEIVGRLTMDQGPEHLKDKINSLISQGRTQIVLDLKRVPYIDSLGLGQLVASYGSVMRKAVGRSRAAASDASCDYFRTSGIADHLSG